MGVRGEQSVMARKFVTPRVGDRGWREGDKGRQGEVDAWLIQYSHRLKSELEQLRGRARQAEKRYVGTSRFVKVFHGRLPSRARDFVSDWPVFCYEPLERFIGITEPRQDNGKQQRHVSP